MDENKLVSKNKVDTFAKVALWQFMAFVFLLLFVWVSEIFDMPEMVFGAEASKFNFFRAALISAAVIACGVISVGHTYEQQRKVINKIHMSCLFCHRVQSGEAEWQHIEQYFLEHFPVEMQQGACPECQAMLDDINKLADDKKKLSDLRA